MRESRIPGVQRRQDNIHFGSEKDESEVVSIKLSFSSRVGVLIKLSRSSHAWPCSLLLRRLSHCSSVHEITSEAEQGSLLMKVMKLVLHKLNASGLASVVSVRMIDFGSSRP